MDVRVHHLNVFVSWPSLQIVSDARCRFARELTRRFQFTCQEG